MKSLSKNLSYQTLYQVLTIITPLITAPYLSRILGAKQLGVFSYTSSVVAYFTLFAMLGTMNYGTKVIAACSNNKKELSVSFFSIYAFQILACLISMLAYVCYVTFSYQDYKFIAYIQAIAVIACVANVNWFLFGLEQFYAVTIRNIFIKIAEVVSILLFVKSESDLAVYILIMLTSTLISNLIAFVLLKKYIYIVRISWQDIKKHIKPNLTLFFPLLAISVYHIMDKTMLGAMSTYVESGYYYNSDKLINIPLCLINGVGVVMLPRVSNMIASGKHEEVLKLLKTSLEMIVAVGMAMSVGIASISNEFVPFFFGSGFDKCIFLTYAFAPILLIKGIVSTVRMQYLIPYGRDREFLYSVCIGAVANLVLNLIFIPKYAAFGAVMGTLGAEAIACIIQLYNIRKELYLRSFISDLIVYVFLGIILCASVRSCALINVITPVKIIIEITVGGLVYGILTLVYWYYNRRYYLSFFCKK